MAGKDLGGHLQAMYRHRALSLCGLLCSPYAACHPAAKGSVPLLVHGLQGAGDGAVQQMPWDREAPQYRVPLIYSEAWSVVGCWLRLGNARQVLENYMHSDQYLW